MIVWGGQYRYGIYYSKNIPFNTGGRYNPATDSWTPTSVVNVPQSRYANTAIWTGTQMIIWGGYDDSAGFLNSGGIYVP